MIDLRSDTVTKPTPGMAEAMMSVIPDGLGDDVYGEDPTVNKLQQKCAELSGKEVALFVTTGCMGNQLAIKSHTEPGNEIIIESESHILHYETAAPAVISNVQLMPVSGTNGEMNLDELTTKIRPKDYYYPQTTLVCLENTHNRAGGSILSIEHIRDVKKICEKHGLKLHLDGARIFNAIVESGISLKEYSSYFDSLSFCFSKGPGAPVGSVLCGSKEFIKLAHKWRKLLGGGMRQSGILAAAALYALENNIERLKDDNNRAKKFANKLSTIASLNFNKVETNIVVFSVSGLSKDDLIKNCKAEGLLISSSGGENLRAVFHLDINDEKLEKAISIMKKVCSNN